VGKPVYIRPALSLWLSTTEPQQVLSAGYIDPTNPLAYVQDDGEMEKLGQTAATPGTVYPDAAPGSAYSTQLRPLTKLNRIISANSVAISRLTWLALDTTLTGSTEQDVDTLSAIASSLTSSNDAVAQARFRNYMLGNFQPNCFRPRVKVDGNNLFEDLEETGFGGVNLGDMTIGLPLPYCWEPVDPYPVDDVKGVEMHAQCCQYVKETGLWQRYPILCIAEWLIS
jgi:hypothetical protein